MIATKNPREIEKMRASGRLLAACMEEIAAHVWPGVSTQGLDKLAEDFLTKAGATPSFKGYGDFPASICASKNDKVVHGIPAKHDILQEGDILSVDLGAILDGWHSDMARTFPVGTISEAAQKLIRVTKESYFAGMAQAVIGNRICDIGRAVQQTVESQGFSVVRELVGHGIGRKLHESPDIPNFAFRGANPRLVEGMTICIEPMVNAGAADVCWLDDGWTVVTKDGSLSAHYENTIAITREGPVILTAL